MDYLKSDVLLARNSGFDANHTVAFDSLNVGSDKMLVVWVAYENNNTPNITGLHYGSQAMTFKGSVNSSPSDNFSETMEAWILSNPPAGVNNLVMANDATSFDVLIGAAVYTDAPSSDQIHATFTEARLLTDDGVFSMDMLADGGVAWAIVKDRGGDNLAWEPALDNVVREHAITENTTSTASAFAFGDRLSGSGTVTCGATQSYHGGGTDDQDIGIIGLSVKPNIVSSGGGHIDIRNNGTHIQKQTEVDGPWTDVVALADLVGPDGPPVEIQSDGTHVQYRVVGDVDWINVVAMSELKGATGPAVELQKSATHIQWREVGTTTWIDLVALSEITGPSGGDPVELRVDSGFIQWKKIEDTTWNNLIALTELKGDTGDTGPVGPEGLQGPAGPAGTDGPAPEMRTEVDMVQWKHTDTTVWTDLYQIPEGGGGSSTTIIVKGQGVTSESMGFTPTGDPVTDSDNLQTFIDNIATDRVDGYLAEGQWELERELKLRDGVRLHGLGMRRTIVNCDPGNWTLSRFTAMEMDDVSNNGMNNLHGIVLSDFQVIGADKSRTDNGGLINIMGLEDFLVERLFLVDGSSYNLFVSGYGEGSFTNDINSDFWNSTHRGTVRGCLSWRGQIGFGTEGGAENILFERNTAVGNAGVGDMDWGLHGFRSASGYNITLHKNHLVGYRNGVLLDRYKHIHILGNTMQRVRNGCAIGSFYESDVEISKDVRVNHNYIQVEPENGIEGRAINDSYISNRRLEGLTLKGNIVKGGRFSIGQARRAIVEGNIGLDDLSYINFFGSSSGLASNNLMALQRSSSNTVIDGGNNIPYANIEGY